MNNSKTVVVVQGPTNRDFVPAIRQSWEDVPIIFSTWEGTDFNCYENSDTVVFNKQPIEIGPANFNLQRVSSLNGFLKAKELGYTRVVKTRSDFSVKNPHGFLDLCKKDCITFYAFVQDRGGYVADFLMEGDIDEMIDLFTIDKMPSFPEQGFTKRLFELGLNKKCNFIYNKLSKEGVDLYWKKYDYWMSGNIGQPVWKDFINER